MATERGNCSVEITKTAGAGAAIGAAVGAAVGGPAGAVVGGVIGSVVGGAIASESSYCKSSGSESGSCNCKKT